MKRETIALSILVGALSLSAQFALAIDQEQTNERFDSPFPNELLAREGAMGPGGGMGPRGDRGPNSGMAPRGDRSPNDGMGPGGDRGAGGGKGPNGDKGPGRRMGPEGGMGSDGNRGY